MFQKALLIYGNLVEFVQVDKEKSSQGTLRFLFAAEVQAVGIAETELGWQQDTAISGFPESLRTYK